MMILVYLFVLVCGVFGQDSLKIIPYSKIDGKTMVYSKSHRTKNMLRVDSFFTFSKSDANQLIREFRADSISGCLLCSANSQLSIYDESKQLVYSGGFTNNCKSYADDRQCYTISDFKIEKYKGQQAKGFVERSLSIKNEAHYYRLRNELTKDSLVIGYEFEYPIWVEEMAVIRLKQPFGYLDYSNLYIVRNHVNVLFHEIAPDFNYQMDTPNVYSDSTVDITVFALSA